jgi:TfoX/Sxy family transcriptional regulator of competence genes
LPLRHEAHQNSEPFRPLADPNRPVSMSYWRVPLEVLEDPAELKIWAKDAIRAATAAATRPRRQTKPTGGKSRRA